MAKCGFVAPPTDVTNLSDGDGNLLEGQELVRYGRAAQGNAQSVAGTLKSHNRAVTNRRVGGTNNDMRAMYAAPTAKLCKVVKRNLDTHMWQNGVMVRTETRPVVTHTTVTVVESLPTGSLLRRFAQHNARREDNGNMPLGILAYCNTIGYVPSDEQIAELLELA